MVEVEQIAGERYVARFDTSHLSPGKVYEVCADFDGPGSLPNGPAGPRIFVSGVSRVLLAADLGERPQAERSC